ncbi:efflux RND transporter permease subunit [Prosthecochloris sp. N3]|uniref:Efflux RND transporter permease subunit n=1 Tax=Prosthecochloris ethylica TaxID=2743976 RepID=A0ABR9XR38_9CHLB|nr:efflux RND transporter permease subunit [Prosthecochloris ethylica]MBF0586393.1 efflux RND transporter permease subunit [Prosthecochloris ethylica]MBF0636389.1 efflux RND transporter permease subunit [Prosthecochloris ethylica]NUK47563.1 efflux RND transporter permease subunit [Prosthecochloris ethylica]
MREGIAGKLAKLFINSKLTPLLMLTALLIGVLATFMTPREEEPQISVPLVDLYFSYPGGSASEVEERVAKPVEKYLTEIEGVKYVYSTSQEDFALVTVRYEVGDDTEESMVKLWATIMKNMDRMPRGMQPPLVKKVTIDDVPVLTLTFWSDSYGPYQLRKVASQVADELKSISDIGDVHLNGGLSRQVRIVLDREALYRYRITPLQIAERLREANSQLTAGNFQQKNREFVVRTGRFLTSADDVRNVVVGLFNSEPVYLDDVAEVIDGPEEVDNYAFFGHGAASHAESLRGEYPAVTLTVAKRKGTDATALADQVLAKIDALEGSVITSGINVTETRNYGETASEKVFTLLEHLIGAVIAVTIVVGLFLGWRGGLVVFASVPITFALTLLVYYLFDYTLNRVTLFALIFVTGIVVDDSIIIAENIHRHFSMRRMPKLQAAIAAINEVGNPTILATFTVIASVLPMVFVSGLMGPYMSPMPIGASLAMIFSLFVALIGTPWLAYRLLKADEGHGEEYDIRNSLYYKVFDKTLSPLLSSGWKTSVALGFVGLLLVGAISMIPLKMVELKMLPFDNKSEFQVVVDMPEGSTLEETARATKDIVSYLKTVPEVENYQYYVGTHAPINFNGLVRHYYLREGENMADIQVNLVHKNRRSDQSHDIAKRVRPQVQEIAETYAANAKVVEVPPGPPVLSTIVAEVYGPDHEQQIMLAERIREIMEETPGVVDVDWMVEEDQKVYNLVVDKEKAAYRGVTTEQITRTLRMALDGSEVGLLHTSTELDPVGLQLRLPIEERTSILDLSQLFVKSQGMASMTTRLPAGEMIPLSELVSISEDVEDKSIYRKNLRNVVYVTADVAGVTESPVYAMLEMDEKIKQLEMPGGYNISPLYTSEPFTSDRLAMKWDGEWQITFEVFRDLGAAFAVVLVIIYLLIIGWFQSFRTPLVMMVAIPLSLVGIIPGHFIHGAFFTATSMIGMIALAGIMVRNSVLIIDFIQLRVQEGIALKLAVIESAAVRTRPILLTAGTVIIGAIVILFDPIFQGLAISLMWGALLSTVLTLGVVPLVYYFVERKKFR